MNFPDMGFADDNEELKCLSTHKNSILDPIVSSPLKYGGTLFLKRHILVEGVEKMFILRKTTLIGEFRVIFFYYRRGWG